MKGSLKLIINGDKCLKHLSPFIMSLRLPFIHIIFATMLILQQVLHHITTTFLAGKTGIFSLLFALQAVGGRRRCLYLGLAMCYS